MNILVIGCGRLGTRLAEMLDERGHDVAVIDYNPDDFRLLSDDFSGITVTGFPMDLEALKSAGIENCDGVAVVTPDDNLNITVSQIAQKFFGVTNVIARISDPRRETVFNRFGLRTVCPTKLATDGFLNGLTQPLAAQNVNFGTSTVAFHSREARVEDLGRNAAEVPRMPGEKLFGVTHRDGRTDIYEGKAIPLSDGDVLIYSVLID